MEITFTASKISSSIILEEFEYVQNNIIGQTLSPAHIYNLQKAADAGYAFQATTRRACPDLTSNPIARICNP